MSRTLSLLFVVVVVVVAGCGRERLRPANPSQPFSNGLPATVSYPAAGIRFRAPSDWRFGPGTAPLVASTSSGSATIAIWRYPRSETLPRRGADLKTAQENLLNAAHGRDPAFKEVRAHRLRIDGEAAVQIVGDEMIAGRPRRVRSTHVYAHGAELVIDAYSAPDVFAAVDKNVFVPLVRSLTIDAPKA